MLKYESFIKKHILFTSDLGMVIQMFYVTFDIFFKLFPTGFIISKCFMR